MDILSIIKKKGEMQELNRDEIRHFVKGFNKKGSVTQAQAAALFAYIYENGMTVDEIAEMVRVMVDTGDTLNLNFSPNGTVFFTDNESVNNIIVDAPLYFSLITSSFVYTIIIFPENNSTGAPS